MEKDLTTYSSIINDIDKVIAMNKNEPLAQEMQFRVNLKINNFKANIENVRQEILQALEENLNSESENKKKQEQLIENESNRNEQDKKLLRGKLPSEIKIENLISTIDELLAKTTKIDKLITLFKNGNLESLFRVNRDGTLIFKKMRTLSTNNFNKRQLGVEWDTKDQSTKVMLDSNEPEKLTINSSSCYNWFRTNLWLQDEDFVMEFETNLTPGNDCWYLGIHNESLTNYTSTCLCCSPANAFYLKCNGHVYVSGKNTKYEQLNYKSKTVNSIVTMRCHLSEKKIWFQVNEEEEQGPFIITGSRFKVIGGACNNCTGTCTITSCYQV